MWYRRDDGDDDDDDDDDDDGGGGGGGGGDDDDDDDDDARQLLYNAGAIMAFLTGVSFLLRVGGYSPLAHYFEITNLFRSGGHQWLLLVSSKWFEWTDSSHPQLNSECTEMPGSIRAQGTTQTG